jgi:tetratricopeptide (TPR) repeat protein
MTGAVGRSAFVAAAFGVHPLHVESVAWVAERKDVLSTFFWWLMILAYVAYVRRPTWEKYGLMLLALALGLMSKPMLVTAPLLLLLLDIWPLSRGSLAHINGWFRLVLEKIPLVGLIVASSIVTLIAQRGGGAVVNVQQLPLEGRISNALLSYVSYLWKAVWPTHLAAFYPFPHDIPFSWVAASAVTLLGLSAVAWRLSRSYPFAFVGWFWFVLTLIPVIGLVQVGSQAMADRYTYVPLVGVFIIVAWGVPAVSTRWSVPMNAVRVSALVVIGALTAAGYVQAGYWRDSTSLWQHAVDVSSGDSFVAHAALGAILEAEGKPEEAMGHYYNAVRSNPDFPDGHLSLGAKLVDRGRVDEAMAEFSEALRLRPDYPEARLSLGMALASKGRTDEAIAQYTEAIRLQPALAIPHFQLGAALATQSRTDGAIAEYREALRLNPDLVDAYVGLGSVFFNEHRWNEAVREWSEAIRLRPDVSNLWLNRGNALATEGRMPEAIRDFSEAVRLSPDSENAHFSLARAFAATGRVPEAIAEFRSVLRLNPRNADAQRSLAALGGRGRD